MRLKTQAIVRKGTLNDAYRDFLPLTKVYYQSTMTTNKFSHGNTAEKTVLHGQIIARLMSVSVQLDAFWNTSAKTLYAHILTSINSMCREYYGVEMAPQGLNRLQSLEEQFISNLFHEIRHKNTRVAVCDSKCNITFVRRLYTLTPITKNHL